MSDEITKVEKSTILKYVGKELAELVNESSSAFHRAHGARSILADTVVPELKKWAEEHDSETDTVFESCMSVVKNVLERTVANISVAKGQAIGVSKAMSRIERQFMQEQETPQQEAQPPKPQVKQEDPKPEMRPQRTHPGPGIARLRKMETTARRRAVEADPPDGDDPTLDDDDTLS